jgi:iron complex outermembrane receptor protein
MNTETTTIGGSVKASVLVSHNDTLRLGGEILLFAIDDRWPAVSGNMMMGPDTFVNLNDANRNRYAGYLEWEREWSSVWSSQIGGRSKRPTTLTATMM